ncbi:hypothetical protein [Halorubrum vacuolatum]|uniref:Uncharacterized protein n=1 Tax=Halorubrum vacuolatum TaxID=63740 RepID=A0A238X4S6_HALVU|nr:hypothetical protein [Halorubrum vacuolatum]SNR53578.1 hypothetical protein SAMN06264855_11338 [Halorubrum vacuolatum]
MVSTVTVKRALAALATRTDTARRPYAAVIDEADAARGDLRRAAGFVDAVGLDRLVEAISNAERDGREARAQRGRDALAAYRRFQAAAADERGTAGTGRVDGVAPDTTMGADHFHSGPGTTKPGNGQGSNR